MSLFARFATVILVAALLVVPAAAGQPKGSAGWSTDGWTAFSGTLYAGPGERYGASGSIEAGVRVRVDGCSHQWCQIHTASLHGWVSQSVVSFGQKPDGLLAGPKFVTQRGGDGTVCFYSGANFTGEALCATSGRVIADLAALHRDNAISSIEIGAGVSAIVCRDRGFHSYCQVVDVSQKHLDGFLDDGISSLRVY